MKNKSLLLAIVALRKMARPSSVEANLHEKGICNTATSRNAYNLRCKVLDAIADLEVELKNNLNTKKEQNGNKKSA